MSFPALGIRRHMKPLQQHQHHNRHDKELWVIRDSARVREKTTGERAWTADHRPDVCFEALGVLGRKWIWSNPQMAPCYCRRLETDFDTCTHISYKARTSFNARDREGLIVDDSGEEIDTDWLELVLDISDRRVGLELRMRVVPSCSTTQHNSMHQYWEGRAAPPSLFTHSPTTRNPCAMIASRAASSACGSSSTS